MSGIEWKNSNVVVIIMTMAIEMVCYSRLSPHFTLFFICRSSSTMVFVWTTVKYYPPYMYLIFAIENNDYIVSIENVDVYSSP